MENLKNDLFEYFAQDHGISLLDSEMNDLLHIVRRHPEAFQNFCNDYKQLNAEPASEADANNVIFNIKKLEKAIPVVWDRYTKTDDGFYVVYGWIAREDGQRDFLMFEMWDYEKPENVFYTTSSAKYSRKIMEVLYGSADEHNDCRKIHELLTEI